MALWPRLRMPLWVAVVIPIAAYAVRSVLRGNGRPDMPTDAIVLLCWLLVLLLAARYGSTAQRRQEELEDEARERDAEEGNGGQDEQV